MFCSILVKNCQLNIFQNLCYLFLRCHFLKGGVLFIILGFCVFAVFLVYLICRCTKRVPYPPPFQKVRRDSKDFEMQPSMTCNSHLLAFENPYYDVIAAMGLDDDIEEDYYNPLYDNMLELQSDSETEPEDMYSSFRNNNYHGRPHYPYDKDSGFSSGTLM
jgi:hypothetical protein